VWKFFLFGVFDGLAGFLFSIGAPNTPATLQNIINQVRTRTLSQHLQARRT
jgi:GH24 family phage-related lysozyme (muramidase)